MANRLEVTTSWLSRYLDLADLPEEIVRAYRDITEIKIIHARKLKPFLSDNLKNKPVKEKLVQKALEIKEKGYEGTRVVTELLNATKTEHKPARSKSRYVSANGLITLHIQKRKDKKLELLIEKKDKATKAEVVEFFATTLDNYL